MTSAAGSSEKHKEIKFNTTTWMLQFNNMLLVILNTGTAYCFIFWAINEVLISG